MFSPLLFVELLEELQIVLEHQTYVVDALLQHGDTLDADANSREMDEKTPHNVSDIMEEQKAITNMGGTMRLGAYECVLDQNSKTFEAYKSEHIQERHRQMCIRDRFFCGSSSVNSNPLLFANSIISGANSPGSLPLFPNIISQV